MALLESLLSSLIYDCLKMGVTHISRSYFDEKISNSNASSMSAQQLNQIYDMVSQLYSETREQHSKYITRNAMANVMTCSKYIMITIITKEEPSRTLEPAFK